MGKGTDKLYITHSEWSSGDQFSASAGSGVRPSNAGHAQFKRLPYNYCALSLQPFTTPVCTRGGQVFDHENIIRWLMKHDKNPTDGTPLKQSDLIKLNFAKNDAEDFVDPVTFKVFTDNTHIIAIQHGDSANVFAYDTVERLNIRTKTWKDLISDEEFSRKDIITLQDPQNLESRDLSSFKYLKDGEDTGITKEEASINHAALGNTAKIQKAKEAVAKARADRAAKDSLQKNNQTTQKITRHSQTAKITPHNASHHTTGMAAASFTSTGVTPHTSGALALLSDEEYLLRRGRVKQKGYVRLETSLGDLTLELEPEYAPKAVWNFVRLAQKGYYDGIKFHRNVRNFMIQGGDPTGTGKGGASVWGKNFEDEFEGPLKHDSKGTLSMANKGKDTNSSQFFILYRAASHLNRKHTIFGRVAEGLDILQTMEDVPTDKNNRPDEDIVIHKAVVLLDPFEQFQKEKHETEEAEKEREVRRMDRNDEDRTTWTGKRIRQDGTIQSDEGRVGKYLKAKVQADANPALEEEPEPEPGPVRKKVKTPGGFGNFDGW